MAILTGTSVQDTYPDVYVLLGTPAPPTVGVNSDVVVALGTAPRGLPNVPYWTSGPAETRAFFGGVTPSGADPTLPETLYLNGGAAQSYVRDVACLRIIDASARTASVTLANSNGDMARLWASSPGAWAAGMTVTPTADANGTTFTLTVFNPISGETETIAGLLPGTTAADNAALITAINNNTVYTKGKLLFATQPVLDAPAAPTYSATSSGGTIPAGTHYGMIELVNAAGRSQGSIEVGPVTLSAPGKLTLNVPAVSGATAWNYYDSVATPGGETFAATSSTFGANVDITAPWTASTQGPAYGPVDGTGRLIAAQTGAGATGTIPTAVLTFPTASPAAKSSIGTNGDGASSAQHVGTAGLFNTGLYALAAAANIKPNVVFLAGAAGTDYTTWATQAQIAHANNWIAVVGLPKGTNPASLPTGLTTALAAIQAGADGDYLTVAYPYVQQKELEYYKTDLALAGHAHYAGVIAAQNPSVSAMFKPLSRLVEGVEIPLTRDQAKAVAGLTSGTGPWINPIIAPDGGGFAFLTNTMASGRRCFVVRMQLLLAAAMQQLYRPLIGEHNDPDTWTGVRSSGTQYLDGLARLGWIPTNPAPGNAQPAPTVATPTIKGTVVGVQPSTAQVAAAASPTQQAYAVLCDSTTNSVGGQITSDLFVIWWVDLIPNIERVIATLNATTGQIVPTS